MDYNGLDYLKQKIGNILKQNNKNKSISPINNYTDDAQNKENIRNENIIDINSNKPNYYTI